MKIKYSLVNIFKIIERKVNIFEETCNDWKKITTIVHKIIDKILKMSYNFVLKVNSYSKVLLQV